MSFLYVEQEEKEEGAFYNVVGTLIKIKPGTGMTVYEGENDSGIGCDSYSLQNGLWQIESMPMYLGLHSCDSVSDFMDGKLSWDWEKNAYVPVDEENIADFGLPCDMFEVSLNYYEDEDSWIPSRTDYYWFVMGDTDLGGAVKNPLAGASDWAKQTIIDAINKRYVPLELQSAYTDKITRLEFCRLAVQFLEEHGDYYYLLDTKAKVDENTAMTAFTDTQDSAVLDCYRLGIIGGKGNGKFDPNGLLTREEAAKILTVISQLLEREENGSSIQFADADQISAWAKEYVDYCTKTGIMNGKNTGFDPKGNYSRQEAIATILRME